MAAGEIALVIAVLAVVPIVALTSHLRQKSADTSVDSFRRQIDALGPQARRSVVERVQNVSGTQGENGTSDDHGAVDGDVDGHGGDGHGGDGAGGADGGGADGG